jgi:hypothetical protein
MFANFIVRPRNIGHVLHEIYIEIAPPAGAKTSENYAIYQQ